MRSLAAPSFPGRGRSPGTIALWLVFLVFAVWPLAVAAQTTWRSIRSVEGPGTIPLVVAGQEFTYRVLDTDEPTWVQVRGPRRLKIVSRYLFGEDDPLQQTYRLRVLVDGREVLRRSFTGRVKEDVAIAGRPGPAVGALRKVYVNIGTGLHSVQVFGETTGSGRIAARFFREYKRDPETTVSFAPEGFETIYHLQFASGSQSTYYHFGAEVPLTFTVTGPTTLKIWTRLDFDHTMNGSQDYTLEVTCDGESWNTFHYTAKKLSSAAYVERPDLLPGTRNTMRIPVRKGQHRFEIKCVRPDRCGISAQIRIPLADLGSR